MVVDLGLCIRKSSNTYIVEVNKVNIVNDVSYKGIKLHSYITFKFG